jgi:Acetoacetate decarboxylase (ADC)
VNVAPPAPWELDVEGVVWADRAWPLAVGGMLHYRDSPVGPYAEVWATPAIRVGHRGPELTIPFMAVDSPASLEGGRANWGLPKTLATFSRAPLTAEGDDWSVRVVVRSVGLRVPLLAVADLVQRAEDGAELRSRARMRGVGRLARVAVDSRTRWLRSGRHPAVLIERGSLVVA